jgi:hypothetical protein
MLTTLFCKKITVTKPKEVENRMVQFKTSLAESSKEGYGSNRAVLPMMMMMKYQSEHISTVLDILVIG